MKKVLVSVGVVALVLVGGFYALNSYIYSEKQAPEPENGGQSTVPFTSASFGISFEHPSGYYLNVRDDLVAADRPELAVVLVEDTQEHRDLLDGKVTQPREGPVAITVDVYPNPQNQTAAEWARNGTTWPARLGEELATTSVGNKEGVSFEWDGLYRGRSVVVTEGGRAYVFSVTWMTEEDLILSDFDTVLRTVSFGSVSGVAPVPLEGTSWVWLHTDLADGTRMDAPAGKFVLSFGTDATVSSATDCNRMSGSFVRDGEVLSFGPFAMTKMFCADSKEQDYAGQLAIAQSYAATERELRINLNRDAGTMVFARSTEGR